MADEVATSSIDAIQIAVYYNKLNEDAIKPYLIMFLKKKPIACIKYEPPSNVSPPKLSRRERLYNFIFRKRDAQVSITEPLATPLDNFKTLYDLLSDLIIKDSTFDVVIDDNYFITNIVSTLNKNTLTTIFNNYNKNIDNTEELSAITDLTELKNEINTLINTGKLLDKNIIDELLKPNPSVLSANQTQLPVKKYDNGTSVNVDIDGNGNIRKGKIISHNSNNNTYTIKYDDDDTEAIVPYNSISINMGGNLRNNKKIKKTLKRKKRNIRKTKNIIY